MIVATWLRGNTIMKEKKCNFSREKKNTHVWVGHVEEFFVVNRANRWFHFNLANHSSLPHLQGIQVLPDLIAIETQWNEGIQFIPNLKDGFFCLWWTPRTVNFHAISISCWHLNVFNFQFTIKIEINQIAFPNFGTIMGVRWEWWFKRQEFETASESCMRKSLNKT